MSRKRIKMPNEPVNPVDELNLDDKILGYPETYTVNTPRGEAIYGGALKTLTDRFERSSMKGNPETLAQNVIHQTITFMTQLIPEDFNNQPANIPELATVFGAIIGMGAAAALDRGEVTLEQIESQTDCFYVAMRQGIPGGILLSRTVDKKLSEKKFGEGIKKIH